jgi:hypothetical protein
MELTVTRPIVRRAMLTRVFLFIGSLGHVSPDSFGAEPNLSANGVRATMTKATRWYREHAATHDGYVYHYSIGLKQHWGEGEASADQ